MSSSILNKCNLVTPAVSVNRSSDLQLFLVQSVFISLRSQVALLCFKIIIGHRNFGIFIHSENGLSICVSGACMSCVCLHAGGLAEVSSHCVCYTALSLPVLFRIISWTQVTSELCYPVTLVFVTSFFLMHPCLSH